MCCKKSEDLSQGTGNPSTFQWTEAINELRSEYPLDLLLELRKMACSVFYYHLKRLEGQDKYKIQELLPDRADSRYIGNIPWHANVKKTGTGLSHS